jgi:hypothetical protein
MMRPISSDRPPIVLTRHFFSSLFDLGFLSDAGVESLKRTLLGCLAGAIAIGLLLTRVFIVKYGALSSAPPDVYERGVMADHAFLIAIPMWMVAAAVSLVGHSLFPDQTDFRVLMVEPLSRLTIFGSKLASLLLFISLIIAATHVALLPLATLTLIGTLKTGSGALVATALSFAFSSVIGSICAALAVVALHGTLVLLAPRARLLAFSGTVRSISIGVLVLSLPLIGRLPGTAGAFASGASASGAWWLSWAPPMWFVGLERYLIGDARLATLAAQAAIITLIVSLVTLASYVLLYRRFDRVVLQPSHSVARADTRAATRSRYRWNAREAGPLTLNRTPLFLDGTRGLGGVGALLNRRAPVRHAVSQFAWITIRRSVMHQGLVVALLSAVAGFVLNGLLSADGWNEPLRMQGRSPLLLALLGAPLTMIFLSIPAIRLALSLPLDCKSNWIFRMTEDAAGRTEVAAANVGLVFLLGVALPLALLGPVQWWMLGPAAFGVIAIEALAGWLLVEWSMSEWRRIPFTCSYIPGKGFVPLMFLKGFHAYVFFGLLTTLILRLSLGRPRVMLTVAAVIGAAAAALTISRNRNAPAIPLTFDDELPTDVNPLRLDTD